MSDSDQRLSGLFPHLFVIDIAFTFGSHIYAWMLLLYCVFVSPNSVVQYIVVSLVIRVLAVV